MPTSRPLRLNFVGGYELLNVKDIYVRLDDENLFKEAIENLKLYGRWINESRLNELNPRAYQEVILINKQQFMQQLKECDATKITYRDNIDLAIAAAVELHACLPEGNEDYNRGLLGMIIALFVAEDPDPESGFAREQITEAIIARRRGESYVLKKVND